MIPMQWRASSPGKQQVAEQDRKTFYFAQSKILGGSFSGRKVAQCVVYLAGIEQLRIELRFFDGCGM